MGNECFGSGASLYDRMGIDSSLPEETAEEREMREFRENALRKLTRGMRLLKARQKRLRELATNELRRALDAKIYKQRERAVHHMLRRARYLVNEERLARVEMKLFEVKLEIEDSSVTADATSALRVGSEALSAEVDRIDAMDVQGIIDALDDCGVRMHEFESALLEAPSFVPGEAEREEAEAAEMMRQLDALGEDPPPYVDNEPATAEADGPTVFTAAYEGAMRLISGDPPGRIAANAGRVAVKA